jgi:hypothetical protein
MILTAKTEAAYNAAARLPCSLPMGNMKVDIDTAFIGCIDPNDYVETAPKNDNIERFNKAMRDDALARINQWRL